jgi:hypothetical protein
MNKLDLGGGYTSFDPTEHTIMSPIPIRWPISVDITIKVDNTY